jgi:heme exporter protein D
MREMYVILGWVGWIWLPVMMTALGVALWVQHVRRQKAALRGFEVTTNDEKQS